MLHLLTGDHRALFWSDFVQTPGKRPEALNVLSIVCPVYNEAEGVSEFHCEVVNELKKLNQNYEIIFVNDGSEDTSFDEMMRLRGGDPRITIVNLSRNFGKEIATTAGLDHVKGEAAIVMDADLQDPPEVIGDLIEGWRQGYDIVNARRSARHGDTLPKKFTANAFYRVMGRISDVPIPENVGDFRLLSRRAVDAVCSLRERHRFMKGVFSWIGYPTTEVLYERAPRLKGETKWNYWKLWNFSIEGLTSSTLAPLKISTYFGFSVALISFLMGVFYASKALFFGDPVPGFPTMVVVTLFLGGVQLIVLGVIGEYLGRIFNETKQRPLYFAQDVIESELEDAVAKIAS